MNKVIFLILATSLIIATLFAISKKQRADLYNESQAVTTTDLETTPSSLSVVPNDSTASSTIIYDENYYHDKYLVGTGKEIYTLTGYYHEYAATFFPMDYEPSHDKDYPTFYTCKGFAVTAATNGFIEAYNKRVPLKDGKTVISLNYINPRELPDFPQAIFSSTPENQITFKVTSDELPERDANPCELGAIHYYSDELSPEIIATPTDMAVYQVHISQPPVSNMIIYAGPPLKIGQSQPLKMNQPPVAVPSRQIVSYYASSTGIWPVYADPVVPKQLSCEDQFNSSQSELKSVTNIQGMNPNIFNNDGYNFSMQYFPNWIAHEVDVPGFKRISFELGNDKIVILQGDVNSPSFGNTEVCDLGKYYTIQTGGDLLYRHKITDARYDRSYFDLCAMEYSKCDYSLGSKENPISITYILNQKDPSYQENLDKMDAMLATLRFR